MIKLRNKSKEDFQIMLNTDNYTQKLLGLEDVIITKVQRNLNETLIFIELPKKPHICPYCASITGMTYLVNKSLVESNSFHLSVLSGNSCRRKE